MSSDGSRHTLVIKSVFGEDEDDYSCQGKNKSGSVSSTARLVINCEKLTVASFFFSNFFTFRQYLLIFSSLRLSFNGFKLKFTLRNIFLHLCTF